MLLPINWVKKYVEVDMSSKELADKLTMTGSNAEEVITLREGISNVVVVKFSRWSLTQCGQAAGMQSGCGNGNHPGVQVPAMLLQVSLCPLPCTAPNCREV